MLETIIRRGTLTAVATLILCVLGIVAATRIPVQMIPDLETRTISIRTSWPGATPQDIEKEIIIEQEEHLRNVPSLSRMTSTTSFGSARIQLEFPFGVDINDVMIDVSNALSRVPSYPNNVREPRIFATSFSDNAFMFFRVMPLPGNPRNINIVPMEKYVKDNVASRLETIPGVSEVRVYGGAERQIQILINPQRLAERQLTVARVRAAIRSRNRDISGGEIESGKRRYLLRTIGRFRDVEDLRQLILQRKGDSVVRLGEVADIRAGNFQQSRLSYTDGQGVIGMSVRREAGSNVIDIKQKMLSRMDDINNNLLNPAGMVMRLVADDVGYVQASIFNVWKNLAIGAALASIIMFLFLRSGRATLVGVMGIPICTIAAFLGLMLAGRTINVISLAGIAFAIGMTLDNGIVVLESIELARRRGVSRIQAAIDGVIRVWPAVLASTLTTILVFVPIIFIAQKAGQLYSDIAIAIAASITASMLVAITILPAATTRLTFDTDNSSTKPGWQRYIIGMVEWIIGNRMRQAGVISAVVAISGGAILFLTPPAEYLPEGEEPKAFASLSSPPGYNLKTMAGIGLELQKYFAPYLDDDPQMFAQGETEVPAMAYFNLSIDASRIRIITQPKDPAHIKPLMDAIRKQYGRYPAMRSFVSRGSIITSNSGGTRSINLDISGSSLEKIFDVAQALDSQAKQTFDNPRVRARPSTLTLTQPMVEIHPRWDRVAETGISGSDLGFIVSAMTDGAFVDEFFVDDEKVDIYMYNNNESRAEIDQLHQLSVYTPTGSVIPLSSIAEIEEKVDTNSIRRVDGRRTVTLNIIPPDDVALETGVKTVREQVVGYLKNSGAIPQDIDIKISGAGNELDETRQALSANYIVALIIIYLLLVAIFTHWTYPLLIMTTIPLGVAGGIIGLWLFNLLGNQLNISQAFDMITMLGFLILMGTVVNNPILIVHQSMVNIREGLLPASAVRNAVATRLRPIAMSTLTTLFGLAPLIFLPGEGTELYRGVGIVVLAGLLGTAIVSLTYLPALTLFFLDRTGRRESKETGMTSGITNTQ